MRIVFAGTPEFAVPSLRAILGAGHEVVGVITREDAVVGRKRVLTPSPVAYAATQLGLAVHKANRLGVETTEWVRTLGAELGVIVAYGGLVREPLLSLPDLGWINLHFSELPRWRGAAPVQRALMAGEQQLGVTVFRLVEALDAGDVLIRDKREYETCISATEVLTDLASFGTRALLEAIDLLSQHPQAGERQAGAASYAHKLTRDDGKIDVSSKASTALAKWAGVTTEPGAFVVHEGQQLKLLEVREASVVTKESATELYPGQVKRIDGRVIVAFAEGALELVRVQAAGKPAMAASDWLRGRGDEAVLS